MTENMRKFVEAAQESEELQNELQELKDEGDGELTLDDLDGAAGGEGWRDGFVDVLTQVYG